MSLSKDRGRTMGEYTSLILKSCSRLTLNDKVRVLLDYVFLASLSENVETYE